MLLLLLISGFEPTINVTLRFGTSGSGDSGVGQFQHGKYFVVRKQEGLLLDFVPIASFEVEPGVRRHLAREILFGSSVEEHVRRERLPVQGLARPFPPRLNHR